MSYEDRISSKRDFNTEWIKRYLPEGYVVQPSFGRWDLFTTSPGEHEDRQVLTPIRTGIATRWEVERLARLHAAGKPLPYLYSAAYWKDIERGKRCWWARIVWFFRWNFLVW